MDGLRKQEEESGQAVTDHQAEEGPSPWHPKTTVCQGHCGGGGGGQPGSHAQLSAQASGTVVAGALPASPR